MKLWSYENLRGDNPMPNNPYIDTECPRANEGGVEAVRHGLDRHPTARLVIVDVLAMFRATAKGKEQTQYDADYLAIKALQALAMKGALPSSSCTTRARALRTTREIAKSPWR